MGIVHFEIVILMFVAAHSPTICVLNLFRYKII